MTLAAAARAAITAATLVIAVSASAQGTNDKTVGDIAKSPLEDVNVLKKRFPRCSNERPTRPIQPSA